MNAQLSQYDLSLSNNDNRLEKYHDSKQSTQHFNIIYDG